MTVRSVNLKLVVPRDEAALGLRQALWVTHAEVNAATCYYERWLLLIRAGAYEQSGDAQDEHRAVSLEEAAQRSLQAARAAQRANQAREGTEEQDLGTDADVLQ